MPLAACPSRTDLSGFNLGRLPEQSLEEIAAHIEQCNRCEEAVKELDHEADPIVNSLRGISPLNVRAATPAAPLPLPYRLGDYELLSELGRGSMGIVYLARHTRLQRVVALKMLLGGEFARGKDQGSVQSGSEGCRSAPTSEYRSDLRSGGVVCIGSGPAGPVLYSRVRRGGKLERPPGRGASGTFPGGELARDTGPRRSLRTRPGNRSSRSETFQCVVNLRWPSQDLRFRRRQAADRTRRARRLVAS